MRSVAAGEWRADLAALHADGFTYLDFLTAIDRGADLELVVRLVNPDTVEHVLVTTVVPVEDPVVDSVTGTFPGANWHERETGEMFGVTFAGHPDPRPLLLRDEPDLPPLRKAAPLEERVTTPWPGAAEPGGAGGRSRRPQLPPGVRDDWTQGRT